MAGGVALYRHAVCLDAQKKQLGRERMERRGFLWGMGATAAAVAAGVGPAWAQ
ncbi:MAG: twin-arginine translocation signal domain-containing protein, partial [Hyphomicrobiaceae bacterium]|nr:twin-arginine translocation signal domain-containing protein [Hyphomicrobiaceae bacterium]